MLDLTCTNTESQSSEGSVCRGMTVATNNCGTWEGETLLRTDNVNNSLALVTKAKVCDAKVLDIFLECHALESGVLHVDKLLDVLEGFSGGGRNILQLVSVLAIFFELSRVIATYMIGGSKSAVWSSDSSPGVLQPLKSLLSGVSQCLWQLRGAVHILVKLLHGPNACL